MDESLGACKRMGLKIYVVKSKLLLLADDTDILTVKKYGRLICLGRPVKGRN